MGLRLHDWLKPVDVRVRPGESLLIPNNMDACSGGAAHTTIPMPLLRKTNGYLCS
jgi:hypothetical protein